MPLGGTQGKGACRGEEAKIGSRNWAFSRARYSALRSPVQNRIMDWLMDELTSNMAEIHESNKREMGREERNKSD